MGIISDGWTCLGAYFPAVAYTDEKITLPLNELVEQVISGKITDGKTQVAILKTANL